jgi:hypothetical protein
MSFRLKCCINSHLLLHDRKGKKELPNFHTLTCVRRVITVFCMQHPFGLKKLPTEFHVPHEGQIKNAYKILFGKPEGKPSLWSLRITGWMIGAIGFDSRRGLGIFLFTTASRTALGPTQPPIQWVPGTLSVRVKRLGREADHSPPTSAEVKEWVELHLHSPNTPSCRGV